MLEEICSKKEPACPSTNVLSTEKMKSNEPLKSEDIQSTVSVHESFDVQCSSFASDDHSESILRHSTRMESLPVEF